MRSRTAYLAAAFGLEISLDLDPWWRIMIGTALLGLANATIGTFAKLITAPLNCMTFGLVWLLINAGLFYWVGNLKPHWGFHVGGFWAALAGSMLMGIALGILRSMFDKNESPA